MEGTITFRPDESGHAFDDDHPCPEDLYADYTIAKIKAGIQWADRRLRLRPFPNAAKFLILYKDACFDFLHNDSSSAIDLVRRIDEIRRYESDFPIPIRHFPTSLLPSKILQLRRYVFWARYGEYAKAIHNLIRRDPSQQLRTEKWGAFEDEPDLWKNVSQALRKEATEKDKKKLLRLGPTQYAMYLACRQLGVNEDSTVKMIDTHVARGSKLIERGFSAELKDNPDDICYLLFDDLQDLGSVVPPTWDDEELSMRAAIQTMRDEWFEHRWDDHYPGTWTCEGAILEVPKGDRNKGKERQYQKDLAAKAIERYALRKYSSFERQRLREDKTHTNISSHRENFTGDTVDGGWLVVPKAGSSVEDHKNPAEAAAEYYTLHHIRKRKLAWKRMLKQCEHEHRGLNRHYLPTIPGQCQINRAVSAYFMKHEH